MDEQKLNSVIEEKVRAAVAIGNADLLKNISSMITQISAPVASSSRQSETPVFKRKSNEEQYKLNSKVLDKIEDSLSIIHSSPEQAKASLAEGIIYIHFSSNALSLAMILIISLFCGL